MTWHIVLVIVLKTNFVGKSAVAPNGNVYSSGEAGIEDLPQGSRSQTL